MKSAWSRRNNPPAKSCRHYHALRGTVLTFISVQGACFLNFFYLEKPGLCLSVLEEGEKKITEHTLRTHQDFCTNLELIIW